jgi:hypothetical protein
MSGLVVNVINFLGGRRLTPPFVLLLSFFVSSQAWGQAEDDADRGYTVESVEINGTSRLTPEQAAAEFGLKAGVKIGDDLVFTVRQKILSLGVFRSATLLLKKGAQPGFVRVLLQVEDDPDVLTDWALGGEVGMTYRDRQAVAAGTAGPPLGYRLGLVSRNLFRNFHRAGAWVDIDGVGIARSGQFLYGLPRFAAEDVQFDFRLSAVDVAHRYLDASGYAQRVEAVWSSEYGDFSRLSYGTTMLQNTGRMAMPYFPSFVAGPTVGYSYESRVQGFLPGNGSKLVSQFIYAPLNAHLSVLEVGTAKTWIFDESVWITPSLDFQATGTRGVNGRAEIRLDVPLNEAWSSRDQAAVYFRMRAGGDRYGDQSLGGSAALIGLRYFSSGFIADLGFHVTRSPREFTLEDVGQQQQEGAEK